MPFLWVLCRLPPWTFLKGSLQEEGLLWELFFPFELFPRAPLEWRLECSGAVFPHKIKSSQAPRELGKHTREILSGMKSLTAGFRDFFIRQPVCFSYYQVCWVIPAHIANWLGLGRQSSKAAKETMHHWQLPSIIPASGQARSWREWAPCALSPFVLCTLKPRPIYLTGSLMCGCSFLRNSGQCMAGTNVVADIDVITCATLSDLACCESCSGSQPS